MKNFIVLLGSAWMNESGFGINYDWDGETFSRRDSAIKHGLSSRGSDDFNIGVLSGGALVSLDWMSEVIDSDHESLSKIAAQIGLVTPATPAGKGSAS